MRRTPTWLSITRDLLGPDGEIMLDCWMAFNEQYTIEFAEMVAPYRVYWMEECLPPHDFEGFGRLREAIKIHPYRDWRARIFPLRLPAPAGAQRGRHLAARHSLVRRLDRAAAHAPRWPRLYDIPVIPHGGGVTDCVHFTMATVNAPWSEMFMPAPGGPPEVYRRFEEDNQITAAPRESTCVPPSAPVSAGRSKSHHEAQPHFPFISKTVME